MIKNKKVIVTFIYTSVIGILVLSTLFIIDGIKRYINTNDKINYTIDGVFDEESIIVSKQVNNTIIRPYLSENVKVGRYYYDYESSSEKQESSIIYYKDTYMQNNGVDYIEDETFDVVSVLDGEIISIEDNEIYGKILTIKHNDNLTTVYSNIEGVLVNTGYKVSQGEIIATSRKNNIDNKDNTLLHFEVYFKGNAIDPENIYTLKVSDIE